VWKDAKNVKKIKLVVFSLKNYQQIYSQKVKEGDLVKEEQQ